jgi:chromosome segregation ATPase
MDRATGELDSNQLLMAQLSRIERTIETLPGLLARLDALTESTRQLETTLRESTRELRTRTETQQQALDNLRVHQSGIESALGTLSSELHAADTWINQAEKRLTLLERSVNDDSETDKALREDLKMFIEEFHTWRPWLKGLKWVVAVVAAVFVTALATALVALL